MNAKQLIETRKAKLAEAETLAAKPEITDEDKAALDKLIAECRALKSDIERAEYLEAAKAEQEEAEKRAENKGERRSKPEHQTATGNNDGVIRSVPYSGKLTAFRRDNRKEALEAAYRTGQFLLATIGTGSLQQRASQWCRDAGVWDEIEKRALSTAASSLGGVLVPDEMERSIIELREERGVARRNCKIWTMTTDTKDVPRRTGGVTVYFPSENGEITASDKAFDSVKLVARKAAALTKYSSELNEDSVIDIANDLTSEFAYALADKEDECLFNGDGGSTYGHIVGIKNALLAGSEVTAATGNTAFSTLDLDDFENMVGKLPQYAVNGAKWYISRAGWASSMLRLAEAAGGNTVNNVAAGAPLQFLGFPVEIVQVMNSTLTAQTSTEGLCYLGNLMMGTAFGDRRGVTIAVDGSRYFEYDQLAIRGTERFDINVHEKGTASVAGCIIQLLTPGS